MVRVIIFLIGFFIYEIGSAQNPSFKVKFSEPLAVLEFIERISANAPPNDYKTAFVNSEFNNDTFKLRIAEFDKISIDYTYEFTGYPYAQKIGGSTISLLKKNLISTAGIEEFKLKSLGLIPNNDLFTLTSIIKAFTPVYREVIYNPGSAQFEKQLYDLDSLMNSKDIGHFFSTGLAFYNSFWDNTIPFELIVYPKPGIKKGFSATAYFNYAVTAIPATLSDYNKLLSVAAHEMFHILYDEQSVAFKNRIQQWVNNNPSLNSRYAFLLLNEALATATANGYVYSRLNGIEDTAAWYNRKYINLMAKKIYPKVKEYMQKQVPIDKSFIDAYIKLYDENFSSWVLELDNLMTDRFVISDNVEDFNVIDQKFPYRSMSDYLNNISDASMAKMSKAAITKIIILSNDRQKKVQLIKNYFPELKEWKPKVSEDFSHSVFLIDKTYLIIINPVKKTIEDHLEMIKLH
jgi:hypothetical protein